MIEDYKILHGIEEVEMGKFLYLSYKARTHGDPMKLNVGRFKTSHLMIFKFELL